METLTRAIVPSLHGFNHLFICRYSCSFYLAVSLTSVCLEVVQASLNFNEILLNIKKKGMSRFVLPPLECGGGGRPVCVLCRLERQSSLSTRVGVLCVSGCLGFSITYQYYFSSARIIKSNNKS